jgi:hypothetical protein|tara:strand:+ start:47 stop:325 length:279 start_codon:yes stop_codon:yes gene_type:complete
VVYIIISGGVVIVYNQVNVPIVIEIRSREAPCIGDTIQPQGCSHLDKAALPGVSKKVIVLSSIPRVFGHKIIRINPVLDLAFLGVQPNLCKI